jgi:hypothetical protein
MFLRMEPHAGMEVSGFEAAAEVSVVEPVGQVD